MDFPNLKPIIVVPEGHLSISEEVVRDAVNALYEVAPDVAHRLSAEWQAEKVRIKELEEDEDES